MTKRNDESIKDRRKRLKESDKALLDKYKGTATKGPGLSKKLMVIFLSVFIIIVLGFTYGKWLYIGSTPLKLIDYSLVQSINTDGRSIELSVDVKKKNPEHSYDFNLSSTYSFDYITNSMHLSGSKIGTNPIFFNEAEILYKNADDWYRYDLKNLPIDGLDDVNWSLFSDVLDLRTLPSSKKLIKSNIEFFVTAFSESFTYGESKLLEIDGQTYDCRKVELSISSKQFAPLLEDFLYFSNHNLDLRESIKDRVKLFLTIVDENDLHQAFNLEKDTIKAYLNALESNFDITYILLYDQMDNLVEASLEHLNNLDAKLELGFYVDKKFFIRGVDGQYVDENKDSNLQTFDFNYLISDYTIGYIENPAGASDIIQMETQPRVDLKALTQDTQNDVLQLLMELYSNFN